MPGVGGGAFAVRARRVRGPASYALAVASIALATLARVALDPILGDRQPFSTYYVAIAATTWLAGWRPALVALALGFLVGDYVFLPPRGTSSFTNPSTADVVGSILYLVVGTVIVWAIGTARRELDRSGVLLRRLRQREERLRRQVADLSQLHELGTQLVGTQDLDALLRSILRAVISLQPADRGAIDLYEPEAHRLVSRVGVGHDDAVPDALRAVPVGEGNGAGGTAAARRSRVVVEDVDTDPLFAAYRDAARTAGFRAVWSTPLLTSQGDLVGVLSTHFPAPYRPNDDEIRLVEVYARLAADAIHALALYERTDAARRAAEQARQRSDWHVENSPIAIVEWDARHRIVRWSPEAERVFGWPAQDVLGASIASLPVVHEEDGETARALLRGMQDGAARRHVVPMRNRRRDGRTLHCVWYASVLADEHGAPASVYAQVVDRTSEVAALEALRTSEAALLRSDGRLRGALREIETVTHRMAAAVTRCSRDLRYLWASARYAEWLGVPRDDVVGRPIVDVIGREAFERLGSYYARVLEGERVEYEEEVSFRGIGRRWIGAVYEPTRDADGAVDGWVAVVTDITRRKELELAVDRARSDAEARLRETTALMAASRELAQALRLDDVLDTVCRVARELVAADGATFVLREGDRVHYAAENAVAPLWKGQRFPIERRVSGWSILERATAVVPDVERDPRVPRDAFRATFVRSLVVAPVRRADPLGAISVYWAAPRTASPEEVRLVEALADVASIAVDNARLFSEATAANQAKDEFLAMLAHELRNPLAPIRNAVAVLRMVGGQDRTAVRARELIDRQVTHMTRLVDDLLDVSRITRGTISLRTEVMPLASVVEEAVDAVRPLVDEHRHTLTVSLPDDDLRLEADRARLTQVLGNLLMNAVKFTPDGGHIAVDAERIGPREAVVRVRDTGIGIAPEMQGRVFDLFAQEDASIARARGGLGIGLTLVRRLVELHGGRAEVSSEGRDRGAEFRVVLPALASGAPAARPGLPAVRRGRDGRLRVLIVEDNVDTAESFEMLLAIAGHEVRSVHRAVDALRLLDEFVPDVAFLDVGLPGMDGFELARRMRVDPRAEGMFLVALTGYGRGEDRDAALRAGFDRHMTKPVDIEAVLALLATRDAPGRQPTLRVVPAAS